MTPFSCSNVMKRRSLELMAIRRVSVNVRSSWYRHIFTQRADRQSFVFGLPAIKRGSPLWSLMGWVTQLCHRLKHQIVTSAGDTALSPVSLALPCHQSNSSAPLV